MKSNPRMLLLAALLACGCGSPPGPRDISNAVNLVCAQASQLPPDALAALPKDAALVMRSMKDACAERRALLNAAHDAGAGG